jgi:hypothetical protein
LIIIVGDGSNRMDADLSIKKMINKK